MSYEYDGLDAYISALESWLQPELTRAYDEAVFPDGTWRLAMGVLVFGRYVDRFIRLGVPSLLAPGNLPALEGTLVIIHTDEPGAEHMADAVAKLRAVASVEVHILPADLLAKAVEHPANKYWLLSAAHALHMHQAKYRGFAYHMLMPDHIYATGFFAGVKRLAEEGREAVIQCNISARLEDVEPHLLAANVALPPEEINALALSHVHPRMDAFILNGRDEHYWPANLYLMMVGQGVHLVSPHLSITLFSHDVLMRMPLRLFNTVDGQLPYLIPETVELYVPTPEDGMSLMEVSDAGSPFQPLGGWSLDEFCVLFWLTVFCDPAFLRFWNLTTELALPEGYVPPYPVMTEEQIAARKARAWDAVASSLDEIRPLLPEDRRSDPLAKAA